MIMLENQQKEAENFLLFKTKLPTFPILLITNLNNMQREFVMFL